MKAEKATSKPLPFTISGYPVDKISRRQLRELKRRADRKGITVEEVIDDALRLYAAKFFASLDPGDKIVRFPKRRSPASARGG
jgi:hypothetical protein